MQIAAPHPGVVALIERLQLQIGQQFAFDVRGDQLLLTTGGGTPFLWANESILGLMLRQADAEQEYGRNGGTLREVPDRAGTRELLIEARALERRDLADGILILALRAYHHADSPEGKNQVIYWPSQT